MMNRLILVTILIIIVYGIYCYQREGFSSAPNVGLITHQYAPAQYKNNDINEFEDATVSPCNRIAVLRDSPPESKKCFKVDCPSPLKEKGYDCFKCKI